MEIYKRLSALMLFLIVPLFVFAQEEKKYVVYYTDKEGIDYTLDNPSEFLSDRAIERRKNQNIELTHADLPVNDDYVKGVKNKGANIYYSSKWFNATLIEAGEEVIDEVKTLSYVDSIDFVKPAESGSSSKNSEATQSYESGGGKVKTRDYTFSSEMQNEMLGIDLMHNQGHNGKGKLIAVFDGGFNGADTVRFFDHLFEKNKIKYTYDFVGNSENVFQYGTHGTQVLSCIGANAGNMKGGGYGSEYILSVTEDGSSEYKIEEYNWLFAAEKADSAGVDIINTSLGYTTFDDSTMDYSYEDMNGKTAVASKAASMAADRGIVCVISVGNEGAEGSDYRYISAPADAKGGLSVGAVQENNERAFFSSIGPTSDNRKKPDVSALGMRTVVGMSNGSVGFSSGTSFAAPLVTGLVAGVWEAMPDMDAKEVIEKVKLSGSKHDNPDNYIGHGVPSYKRFFQNFILDSSETSISHKFKVYPNPVKSGKDKLFIQPDKDMDLVNIETALYSTTGKLLESGKHNIQQEDGILSYPLKGYKPGVYILRLVSADISDTFRVIKF